MRRAGTKARMGIAFFISFLIAFAYFSFVYQKIPFIYDINDDVAMRNVASGVITGEPDGHLIFIKYALGFLISGMYKMLPGWDWYGIFMTGTILLALTVVLYRGIEAEKSFVWKIIYTVLTLLLFTCIGVRHIAAFQWTLSAAFAGVAGIYLFYTSGKGDRFQIIAEEIISLGFLLLCFLIRQSVFMMIFPVAVLCFWWKHGRIERKENGKLIFSLKHWGIPAALILGVLCILVVENGAYRSPEWKEFLAYNTDRSTIMDYYGLQNYEDNREFYDSLSLSPEETENLQRYSLYLCDGLYSQTMHELAENAENSYMEEHSLKTRVKEGIYKAWTHLSSETYRPVSILAFIFLAGNMLLCWRKDRREMILSILLNILWIAFWLYLGYKGRIVERVAYSLFLLSVFSMLAIGYAVLENEEKQKKEGRKISAAVIVLLALILCKNSMMEWKNVKENLEWRSSYNKEFLDVNRYMAEHPQNVYFMTTFSIETYTDNFTLERDFEFSNLLSVGGWHTFSPLENEKNRKLGITDPKRDIVENENVYLISLENVNLRYMDRYYDSIYKEEYQGRELIDTLDYGERIFEIYDFSLR